MGRVITKNIEKYLWFYFLGQLISQSAVEADVSFNLLSLACIGPGLGGTSSAGGGVRWVWGLRRGDCPHARRTVFVTCIYVYLFGTVKRIFRHLI